MSFSELKILVFFVLLHFSQSLDCGKVKVGSAFIAGGEQSRKGQWPWLASLFMKNSNKFFCGSSIISKKHLLGAAHCFHDKFSIPTQDSNVYALLGRYDLLNNDEVGTVKRDVDQSILHPGWMPLNSSFDADIAIILLKLEIPFSELIQPVCLPSSSTTAINKKGIVVGYGLTSSSSRHETKPRYVEISSIDHGTCLYTDPSLAFVGSLRMFCAGEKGRNPCKGDSGSGFYVKDGFTWTILGVTSAAATDDCQDNQFVLFSNVPKFIPWITAHTKTPNRPCNEGIIADECMKPGDVIYSCHNCFILAFLYDGNFGVYTMKEPITAVWSSGTQSRGGVRACMQGDGNFVIYTADNVPIWSTGTLNNPGAYAEMQFDGQFAIWKDGQSKYVSGKLSECVHKSSKLPEKTIIGEDRPCNEGLKGGECMQLGDVVYSCHKCFKLTLLYDGVLAVYTTTDPIRSHWSTDTAGKGVTKACMQTDGNFVLYTANGVPIWATETINLPGAYAEMQSDGQLAIWKDGHSKWHSGPITECKTPSNE